MRHWPRAPGPGPRVPDVWHYLSLCTALWPSFDVDLDKTSAEEEILFTGSLRHCGPLCSVIWHRITVSAPCHHLSSSGLDITICSHRVTQFIFWGEIEWVSGNIAQQLQWNRKGLKMKGYRNFWMNPLNLSITIPHSLALACIRRLFLVVRRKDMLPIFLLVWKMIMNIFGFNRSSRSHNLC